MIELLASAVEGYCEFGWFCRLVAMAGPVFNSANFFSYGGKSRKVLEEINKVDDTVDFAPPASMSKSKLGLQLRAVLW